MSDKDDLVTRKGMGAHEGVTDARQRSRSMQVGSGESRTSKWTDGTGKTTTITWVDGQGPYVSVQNGGQALERQNTVYLLGSPRSIGAFWNGDVDNEVYAYSNPKNGELKRKKKRVYKTKEATSKLPQLYPLEQQPGNRLWQDTREEPQVKNVVSWWGASADGLETESSAYDRSSVQTPLWYKPLSKGYQHLIYLDGGIVANLNKLFDYHGTIHGACVHKKPDGAKVIRAIVTYDKTYLIEFSPKDGFDTSKWAVKQLGRAFYVYNILFNSSGTKAAAISRDDVENTSCIAEIDGDTGAITYTHKVYNSLDNNIPPPAYFQSATYSTTGDWIGWSDWSRTVTNDSQINWTGYQKRINRFWASIGYKGDELRAFKIIRSETSSAIFTGSKSQNGFTSVLRIGYNPTFYPEASYDHSESGSASETNIASFKIEDLSGNVVYDSGSLHIADITYEFAVELHCTWPDCEGELHSEEGSFNGLVSSSNKINPLDIYNFSIFAASPAADYIVIGKESCDARGSGALSKTIELMDYVKVGGSYTKVHSATTTVGGFSSAIPNNGFGPQTVFAGSVTGGSLTWSSFPPNNQYTSTWVQGYAKFDYSASTAMGIIGVSRLNHALNFYSLLPTYPTAPSETKDYPSSSIFNMAPYAKYSACIATWFVKGKPIVYVGGVYTGTWLKRGYVNGTAAGMTNSSLFTWMPGETNLNNVFSRTEGADFGITVCHHYYDGTIYQDKAAVHQDVGGTPDKAWIACPIFIDTYKFEIK